MKVRQIGPTFLVPGKTVNFLEVKSVAPSSTLKMRKSHKKLAHVYTRRVCKYVMVGANLPPPPVLIGLNIRE